MIKTWGSEEVLEKDRAKKASALKDKKKKMSNKYLEKIAGLSLGGFGRKVAAGAAIGGVSGAVIGGPDNRIKGALAGATAGGIAGSVFGRATSAIKNKNVFNAGPGPGSNAKVIN